MAQAARLGDLLETFRTKEPRGVRFHVSFPGVYGYIYIYISTCMHRNLQTLIDFRLNSLLSFDS